MGSDQKGTRYQMTIFQCCTKESYYLYHTIVSDNGAHVPIVFSNIINLNNQKLIYFNHTEPELEDKHDHSVVQALSEGHPSKLQFNSSVTSTSLLNEPNI